MSLSESEKARIRAMSGLEFSQYLSDMNDRHWKGIRNLLCKFSVGVVLGGLLLIYATWGHAAVIPLPEKARIVDTTGTLSQLQIATLSTLSDKIDKETKTVLLAVIVPSLNGEESIEQFSMRIADAWMPGHKDVARAAIFVVVKNDHKMRLEVSRTLGQSLTDSRAAEITDSVKPLLKSGDFAGGINQYLNESAKYASAESANDKVSSAPVAQEDKDWGFVVGGIALIIACWLFATTYFARKRREHFAKLKREADAREELRRQRLASRLWEESEPSRERASHWNNTAKSAVAAGVASSAFYDPTTQRKGSTLSPVGRMRASPPPPPASRQVRDDDFSSAAAFALGALSSSPSRSSSNSDNSPSVVESVVSFVADAVDSFDGGGSSDSF